MEVKLISMKKVLVIVSVLFASIASKAQSNAIQNLWAFAKGIMYGKELRGPDGAPVQRNDTAYFLYMEIKGLQKPEITSISYRNKNFSPAVYEETGREVTPGLHHATGKAVLIRKKAGNSLWRIELHPPGTTPASGSPSDKMIIKGKANKKAFTLSVKEVTLLESDIVG